jgi:uncharacterized protein (TIGR00730 family)
MLKSICVFCGSSPGTGTEYMRIAKEMGKTLAEDNIRLIYGGSNIGLMGIIAKTVLEHGGKVTGVMPKHLVDKEIDFKEITDFKMVNTMHERKAVMEKLSDGFIAMPGGFGTMDEIFEIITWAQLQLHMKPCGFLNISKYYDKLFDFINHAIDEKFINASYRHLFQIDSDPQNLIKKMQEYQPLIIDKAKLAKSQNGKA